VERQGNSDFLPSRLRLAGAGRYMRLRLYERLGFEAWGRVPEATEHDGQLFDEIHMTIRL